MGQRAQRRRAEAGGEGGSEACDGEAEGEGGGCREVGYQSDVICGRLARNSETTSLRPGSCTPTLRPGDSATNQAAYFAPSRIMYPAPRTVCSSGRSKPFDPFSAAES